MIHVTSTTASAAGAAWRRVHCTHCTQTYIFRLDLEIKYTEADLYGLGSSTQRDRAVAGAQYLLHHTLLRKIVCVPCPTCMCYPPDMCEDLRRQKFSWMFTAGMFLLVAAFMGVMITGTFIAGLGEVNAPPRELILVGAIGTVVAGILCAASFILQRKFWAWYNPNDPFFEPRRLEIARSRAMTEEQFAATHPGSEAFERELSSREKAALTLSSSGPSKT